MPFYHKIFSRLVSEQGPDIFTCIVKAVMTPAAGLYLAGAKLRRRAYGNGIFKAVKLHQTTVISVGALQAGGTGKTPFVIFLAKSLTAKGLKVVVLSRGYGGASKAPVNLVSAGGRILLTAAEAGDEPVMLAASMPQVPVITGPARAITGPWARDRFHPDVIILDDGFQHLGIERDLNILLLDAARPFSNRRIFPLGPLREPPRTSLRADVIILTRSDLSEQIDELELRRISVYFKDKPVFRADHIPASLTDIETRATHSLDLLVGRKIAAFAGLANNESLFSTLKDCKAIVKKTFSFPDHYRITAADERLIKNEMDKLSLDLAVTTEKDAVKMSENFIKPHKIYSLGIKIKLDHEEKFTALVLSKTAGRNQSTKPF